MIKYIQTGLLLPFIIILSMDFPALAQDLSAREIVQRANDNANGNISQGTMKMIIVRPDWSREVIMKSWSKGTEFYLIYITEPFRDKG